MGFQEVTIPAFLGLGNAPTMRKDTLETLKYHHAKSHANWQEILAGQTNKNKQQLYNLPYNNAAAASHTECSSSRTMISPLTE